MNTVIINGVNVTEELEKTKSELNELRRDVARYLELQEKYEKAQFTFTKVSEMQEYFRLNQKLLKGVDK